MWKRPLLFVHIELLYVCVTADCNMILHNVLWVCLCHICLRCDDYNLGEKCKTLGVFPLFMLTPPKKLIDNVFHWVKLYRVQKTCCFKTFDYHEVYHLSSLVHYGTYHFSYHALFISPTRKSSSCDLIPSLVSPVFQGFLITAVSPLTDEVLSHCSAQAVTYCIREG